MCDPVSDHPPGVVAVVVMVVVMVVVLGVGGGLERYMTSPKYWAYHAQRDTINP